MLGVLQPEGGRGCWLLAFPCLVHQHVSSVPAASLCWAVISLQVKLYTLSDTGRVPACIIKHIWPVL